MGEAVREDESTVMVTVFEYLRDKYKIDLNWPELPLVTLSTFDLSDKFPMEACFCKEDQASDMAIGKLVDSPCDNKTGFKVYFRTRLAPHDEEVVCLSASNPAIMERCSRCVFKYNCHGVTAEMPCKRHD